MIRRSNGQNFVKKINGENEKKPTQDNHGPWHGYDAECWASRGEYASAVSVKMLEVQGADHNSNPSFQKTSANGCCNQKTQVTSQRCL